MHSSSGYAGGALWRLFDRNFWFILIWLLPLGLIRLRRLPRSWIIATGLACAGALTLGAYHSARGNVARPLFSVAGPLLSLSVAIFLTHTDRA